MKARSVEWGLATYDGPNMHKDYYIATMKKTSHLKHATLAHNK